MLNETRRGGIKFGGINCQQVAVFIFSDGEIALDDILHGVGGIPDGDQVAVEGFVAVIETVFHRHQHRAVDGILVEDLILAEGDIFHHNADRRALVNSRHLIQRQSNGIGCIGQGVAGLEIGDVNIQAGRAMVFEKGLGGNHKSRTVFFSDDETKDAIIAWLEVRPKSLTNYVFLGDHQGPLTPSGIYQIFRRTAEKAGVQKNWNPHQWRHAFSRTFLRNGGDIGVLSQLLGHSDIKVTIDHYGWLLDEDLQAAYNKHAPFQK